MNKTEFLDQIMKENMLEIKTNNFGRALYYNGIPLHWTENQSDEYMYVYALGFVWAKVMFVRHNR